jgi:pseudaminic acid cytidylyltransferase
MNVALIPVRGGSKRIPRKNIKHFCGKPIIAYSIEAAIVSKLFDKVIISTDDKEIAETAKGYGAEVPFIRPANLSDDYTATNDVIIHCINWFLDQGYRLNSVCLIYATAPLIRNDDLIEAHKIFLTNKWEFVFSATSFVYPIQRAFMKLETGGIKMFQPEHFRTRSQDLPTAYHDASQFTFGKTDAWLDGINTTNTFSEKTTFVTIPPYRAVDIDTEEDWIRAELIMELLKK